MLSKGRLGLGVGQSAGDRHNGVVLNFRTLRLKKKESVFEVEWRSVAGNGKWG